jgi:hypothetical protein
METFKGSVPAYAAELDLGNIPATDIGIVNSEYHSYFPVFSVKDAGNPVQFIIPSSNNLYLNLDSSFLYLKLRILKSDGTKLTSPNSVAPTFNFFRSLFSSCEIMMNSTVVSKSATLFPYRGHILDTLVHGDGYKSGQLYSQIYIDDKKSDDFSTANPGFVTRSELSKLSNQFEVVGKLSESIFDTNRFFPPDVTIRITLRRSDPSFCLDSNTAARSNEVFPYSIEFDDCSLYVRKYVVNLQVVAHHHKLLTSNGKLHYPIKTYELRSFNITSGTQQILSESLFRNYLPKFVVVTFLDSSRMTDKIEKSCFCFEPFSIQSLKVSTDGESTLYRQIDLDTENNICLLAYNTLFSALSEPENGISISRAKYLSGSFL